MNIIKTNIEGVLIIEPRLFRDACGYFFESFSEREFKEKVEPLVGYEVKFCQDNYEFLRCDERLAFPVSSFYSE